MIQALKLFPAVYYCKKLQVILQQGLLGEISFLMSRSS